jgi:TPR repeat protein
LGDEYAQNNLGLMYRQGNGVLEDNKEAAKWFQKAVAQGSPEGMTNLAMLYATGEGMPQNCGEAAKLYSAALDKKFAPAACRLAELYVKGCGVPQDLDKARKLCKEGYQAGAQLCKDVWENYGLSN